MVNKYKSVRWLLAIWRNSKNGRKIGRAEFGCTLLNSLVRKDFTIKVTFQQTARGDGGKDIWICGGKSVWAEGTARVPSQALDLGGCLVCSRKQKEAVLAGLKSSEETIRENVREEMKD